MPYQGFVISLDFLMTGKPLVSKAAPLIRPAISAGWLNRHSTPGDELVNEHDCGDDQQQVDQTTTYVADKSQ